MKKISVLFSGIAMLALVSCQHQDRPLREPVWETSSASLEVQGREVLTYTLPADFQKEEPVISARPANAALVELVKDNSGQWTLRYQSSDGKTADNLSIDSEDEAAERAAHQGGCAGGHHPKPLFGHPKPGPEHEGHYRLLVNLQVKTSEANLLKGGNSRESR